MSVFNRLVGVIRTEEESDVLYECRRCGTSLDVSQRSCPMCGSGDCATYEL
jgi:rubrerythrin